MDRKYNLVENNLLIDTDKVSSHTGTK